MSNLSLYQISEELTALDELLEQDGGEITEEYEDLEKTVMHIMETKVDGCVEYVNREKDLIALAKEKIKQLQEFAKAKERKVERFSEYVKMVLDKTESKVLNGQLNQIKIRKPSPVLTIEDESAVPVEFTTVQTTVKIDKAALKKAVKAGTVNHPKIRLEDGKTSLIFGLIRNSK